MWCSDGVPLFGYRRRSYLVLCGLLGAAAWGALATIVHNKYAAVSAILLSSLSVAFSDVVSITSDIMSSICQKNEDTILLILDRKYSCYWETGCISNQFCTVANWQLHGSKGSLATPMIRSISFFFKSTQNLKQKSKQNPVCLNYLSAAEPVLLLLGACFLLFR